MRTRESGGSAEVQVLHVTNTDVARDSRILKELLALDGLRNSIGVIDVPEAPRRETVLPDRGQLVHLFLRAKALTRFPRAIRYALEMIEFTAKAVRAGRRLRPTVVHCHDTFALPAGWLLKILVGSKLVYDAHELESDKNGQNAVLSAVTILIERVCWEKIDLLISVSDSILEWYKSRFGPKRSILVLNSPVVGFQDTRGFSTADKDYFRKKYGIPDDHLIFVYLGILGPGRGIEACLEAFARGPEKAHVIFIGFGILETRIREHAAAFANIHFHEAVAHEMVVPLVRNADYGLCMVENVSLSDYYCLPNKLFEYIFAGLPVLASDFPEISKLVVQYQLGHCCAPSARNIREELKMLVESPVVRLSSDISSLGWEAQADRLRSAYLEYLL